MRNLLEYPITADEVIIALAGAYEQEKNRYGDDMPMGGTDLMVLAGTKEFLAQNPKIMAELLESMRIQRA